MSGVSSSESSTKTEGNCVGAHFKAIIRSGINDIFNRFKIVIMQCKVL